MSCYAWQLACLSAFAERDHTKRPFRIAMARSIIARRFLESIPVGEGEWLKIESTVKILEALEKEGIPTQDQTDQDPRRLALA